MRTDKSVSIFKKSSWICVSWYLFLQCLCILMVFLCAHREKKTHNNNNNRNNKNSDEEENEKKLSPKYHYIQLIKSLSLCTPCCCVHNARNQLKDFEITSPHAPILFALSRTQTLGSSHKTTGGWWSMSVAKDER